MEREYTEGRNTFHTHLEPHFSIGGPRWPNMEIRARKSDCTWQAFLIRTANLVFA